MSQHQAFKRTPVNPQVATKQETLTFPAPTRGLIMSENESYMQPGAAVVCDNWAPTMRGAKIRGGHDLWVDLYAHSNETVAFLARTSGLDTTHTNAYTALIDGLVADGLWSKLDLLHIYATQDTATAQLNLVQTSYPATLISSPSFTADRGYTGAGSSYIKTGFIPNTAVLPKSTRNSAHISVWNLTNATTSWQAVGGTDGTTTYSIIPRLSDGNSYFGPNTGSSSSISVANADARGHFLANRSSSVQADGYKNGSPVVSSGASGSFGPATVELYALALNSSGTPLVVGYQEAMISVGSSMNATEAGNFYNRLRTYMTAVGVP